MFFIPFLYKFNTLLALNIISSCNLFDTVISTLFFTYLHSIYFSVTGNIFCIKNVLYVLATYPKTLSTLATNLSKSGNIYDSIDSAASSAATVSES